MVVASVVLLTFIIPAADTVAAVEEPILVTPSPLANIVAFEEVKLPPITAFFTTDKPPSVCKEPSYVVIASVALLTFTIPVADTVAPVVEPIVVTPALLANVVACVELKPPTISVSPVISISPLETIFKSTPSPEIYSPLSPKASL